MQNTLYYGDNLQVLREDIKDESVDLVYIDPPFNSSANYNVIFREHTGNTPPEAQIRAFKDTWTWTHEAEESLDDLIKINGEVAEFLDFTVRRLGHNDLSAYLVMMAVRLVELHRVLKPTGSFYLHCDPTASHYLKVLCDVVFGARNYRNEIVWKRQSAHSDAKYQFAKVTDTILFYVKSSEATFTPQYGEHDPEYVKKFYRHDDNDGRGRYSLDNMASPSPRPNMMYDWKGYPYPPKGWRYEKATMQKLDDEGRIHYPKNKDGSLDTSKRLRLKRYLSEQEGSIITNVWTDIQPLHGSSSEKLGYPTQKPLSLLERIIQASSNPGDVVLDAFCGCGTAVVAAHKLGRKWVGIDVTHLAVSLVESRLKQDFGLEPKKDFWVEGTPETKDAAQFLFDDDPYQFQFWAVGLIGAQPYGATSTNKKGKKGGDTGIDGVMYFRTPGGEKIEKAIVSVKGGKSLAPAMVRELEHVVEREKAAIGVFLTLHEPTKGMEKEAAAMGLYEYGDVRVPKIQIRTVEQLLNGNKPDIPQGSLNVSLDAKEQKTLSKESKKRNQTSLFESDSK